MAAVTNGIRTSFSNTPQARDDQFTSAGLTEDSLGVKYLDVMGNDLGGNAKTLYSLDDGISAGGSSPTDLLDRDAVGAVNTSALGAKIWITADGRVAYDASQIQAQFQYLAAGEYATDSFTYAIQLGNGALSWATATVRIAGVNDAPVISSQPADAAGAVQEDTTLIAAGTLAATDVDHNATQAWSVQGSAAGAYGAIAVDGATGKWTYTLANDSPAVQALAANESHDETFTVRVTDDQSATAEQLVTVKVTGANDAPVVSGTVTGTATEDGAPSVLNALANASDVDNGTTLTVTNANLPAGVTYDANAHSFTLDPSNAAYQSLAAGTTKPVSVNYSVSDGITSTPATASWTVTGVNDAPVIGLADATGAVTAMPATPVGTPTPIVFTVEQYLGHQSNNLSELRNYAAAHQPDYTVQTNVIDFTDDPAGFAGELPGSSRWPAAEAQNYAGTGGINNSFFARITAHFSVPAADTYTFRTYNDDGVFLMIDNQLIINDSGIHPEAPFNGSITLSPGNHSLELFFFEFGGEASLELSARNSTGTFGLLGASGGGLGGTQTASDSGAMAFSDVDLSDAHLVSASPIGSVLGTLTVEKNSDTTGTGAGGQLTWRYEVPNSAIEYLAAGQTKVESFTVTLDDQHGGVITRQVDVTVTGINDAPVAVNDTNALTVTSLASQVHTNTVNWVNWTSNTVSAIENIGGTLGAIGTVSGTIDVGNGQSIGVTYTGEYQFAQIDGATTGTPPGYPYGGTEHYYYTGTNVYTSASVANAPPDSDIIALNFATQTRTLTFSEPVENLYFAVVSMNNNGYVFDQDFQVVSYGPGYWGNGTLTRVDNHNGTYTVSGTGEPHGVLSINGSVGKLTWTSAANEFWNGFTVGTYGKALTGTAMGNVLANDSDVEHDTLSVTAVNNQAITGNSITLTLASGATLNVNRDGTYLYDENGKFGYLAEGQTAQEGFQYTVTDSHGASSAANVTITLTGVNDAPVAVNDIASTNEDNAVTIAVLANDTDPDAGDSKTLDSVAGAQHGTVAISGSNLVYTPSANYNGADSLTYTIKDAAGAQSTATVNVTVNPVSDTYTLSNLVVNGSFEQFGSGNTSTGSTAITGWTVIGSDVDRVAASGWQPGDGTYSLDLNGFHPGGVQQFLQTTPGVQYTVGFDLSKNPGNLTYATVKVSVDDTNQTSQSYSFSAGNSSTNMMWSQQTFTFTATGTTTALGFASTYPTDSTGGFPINAQGPALDEVVVVANKVINNFTTGTGGDVLQLHDLLTSIGAPHDGTAISGGYLGFAQSGSDTLVQIDPNGGGDAYMTVATLVGVSDQLDASNYVL